MGMYTEMRFPELGVRFIAVESGVDSNNQQSTEFTPFLNVIKNVCNESSSRISNSRLENATDSPFTVTVRAV